jgi:hypothetical protein
MAAGKTGAFSIASLLADAKETKIVDSEEEGQASASGIRVELENRELWEKFSFIGNEMILTKSGRRIFPALRFLLRGLDPKASYELMVGIEPIDVKRYRYCYQRSQWIENPVPEQDDKATSSGTRIYVHPASPATGTYWMRETISFEKMKLTNNWKEDGGHIVLQSMHRYRPRLYVACTETGEIEDFTFDETTFMAVTAYQNPQITKLKIEGNPFARGFRTFSGALKEGRQLTAHRTVSHKLKEVGVNSWRPRHPNYSYHGVTPPYSQPERFSIVRPSICFSQLSGPPPLLHVNDYSLRSTDVQGHNRECVHISSTSPIRGTWLTGVDGLCQSASP